MLNMLSACAQKSIEGSLKADESQHLNESALMGLKYGALVDSTTKMHYSGYQYSIKVWNNDLTIAEAMQFLFGVSVKKRHYQLTVPYALRI